jgi:hypothetical protein
MKKKLNFKITERILLIDVLLRENKAKKLGKQQILDELNKRLVTENLKPISIRQFDNDIGKFENRLKEKLSKRITDKTIYFYKRSDISINNSIGVKSKDIKLAIDFIKGFRGENILLKSLESEIQKKFNVNGVIDSPFHLESNCLYDKEYSKFIPKIYKAIVNSIVLRIKYTPRFKESKEEVYTLHPYKLKEFNGRWFVFGYSQEKPASNYFHLAIDNRIVSIEENHTIEFKMKSRKIDYDKYFNERVGVSNNLYGFEEKKYRIKLRFKNEYFNYFQSKPISNLLGRPRFKDDFVDVTFEMHITNELISRIFSYKSNVEVLEPEILKKKIKDEIDQLNDVYE